MRIAIAYPPDFAPPTMPFAALPLLSACVQRAGHDARIIDLNAEAFSAMLWEENLQRYFEVLDQLSASAQKLRGSSEGEQLYQSYRLLHVFPRDVIRKASEAAANLRDPEFFFDPARYRQAARVIRTAHAFLDAMVPRLDPRNTNFTRALFAHLAEDPPDPYVEFYDNVTIPALARFGADVVAMSCPFSQQIGTALRFAKSVRKALPNVRLVVGGTGIDDAQQVLLTDRRFYDYVDYAIVGDGEEALIDLLSAIGGSKEPAEVAGLWRADGREVVRPSRFRFVDMDESPVPDYGGVDFSHYMLPEPAGFYTTSRGCYYGKCTFCPESFRVKFRMRSPERVYEDIRDLVLRQGVRNLHFFDPLTPPRTLAYISRQVAREKLPLNYHAEVKFEKIYTSRSFVAGLAAGGCRLLQFGFESGVQRVLDDMKKGNRLDQVEIMLANLREHGIVVATTWFIGFPTENEADARATWRFIREHSSEIHYSMYTGTFGMGADVPVFQHPEEYDIEICFDAAGNPTYRRKDGGDWDQQPLHEGFHARSDGALAVSGAALMYAANFPDRIARLRGRHALGRLSWEDPPVTSRRAAVPRENGLVDISPPGQDGRRFKIYVAESGELFDADPVDGELLTRIGHDGRLLAEVVEEMRSSPDVEARLARMLDRGVIEVPEPASVALAAAAR